MRVLVMLNLFLTLIDDEGDKARFVDFYEKYKRLMFYVARGILKDDHLAEDAVQEAFLRVAKNFHKINDVSCPQTRNFAVIITRNISLNMLKKKDSIIDIDYYTDNEMLFVADDLFESVSASILTEKMFKLPESYRDILYLYHLYGYSFNEISNLLSLPAETTKKRAQRARHMLKEMLEKEGYYHE